MPNPKLHHFVPQFYLRRFQVGKRLWVFDKKKGSSFPASTRGVAAEMNFYQTPLLLSARVDPFFLEKELSELEGAAASITEQWLTALEPMKPFDAIEVSDETRSIFSTYLSVQWLKTTGTKEILEMLVNKGGELPPDEIKNLHHSLLVVDELMRRDLTEKIYRSIWIFGQNGTAIPFVTSDNPVTVHGADHIWLRSGIIKTPGTCITLPLSPALIFFAYERSFWRKLIDFDCTISPVKFTNELVIHENTGQVCNSSRFVISSTNDFDFARDLIEKGYAKIVDPKLVARPDTC